MGRAGTNGIWRREHVKIEPSGNYIRLIAPCGQSRRVTPETARKIAADLVEAAGDVENRPLETRLAASLDNLDARAAAVVGVWVERGGDGEC